MRAHTCDSEQAELGNPAPRFQHHETSAKGEMILREGGRQRDRDRKREQ